MLYILLDGIQILYKNIGPIVIFVLTAYGFGVVFFDFILKEGLDSRIGMIVKIILGCIVLSILTFVLFSFAHFYPFLIKPGSYTILLLAIIILVRSIRLVQLDLNLGHLVVAGSLFLLLLARLAFLKQIILPPYSDSPIHYQIVHGFLQPDLSDNSRLSIAAIFSNYYHFGFHSLAAWLTSVTGSDPANMISLLGQLFLVLAPASVLFLAYALTKHFTGAVFAGLLAAIGWTMPAFAVNWGKYPAISSLAVVPAVLGYLLSQSKSSSKVHLFWGCVLSVGILLMHTRSGVFLMLAVFCYHLTGKLIVEKELDFFRAVRYSVLYGVTLWALSKLLSGFYGVIPVWVILLVLVPFAFQYYPRLAITIFFFTFGIWLTSIPLEFLDIRIPVLVDRQFLVMMFYVPFSVMGGAGLGGLMKKISARRQLAWLLPALIIGVVVVNFIQIGVIYPDACCNYYGESDKLAFDWIRRNKSEHTLVLISTFENDGQVIGTDAGIWLYPLIGQPTNKTPFNVNWDSLTQIHELCGLGAKEVLIYAGGRAFSFDEDQLDHLEWIDKVFTTGKISVYKVLSSFCQGTQGDGYLDQVFNNNGGKYEID